MLSDPPVDYLHHEVLPSSFPPLIFTDFSHPQGVAIGKGIL
jgi:hypothetical protein